MPRTIEITISPTGEVTVETRGFRGEQCREATQGLEEALGRVTAETLTREYHLWSGAKGVDAQKVESRRRPD